MKARFGLKAKFIVSISVLLTAFTLGFTLLNIRARQESVRIGLEEKARAMVSLLGAGAVDPLATLRVEELRFLLIDLKAQHEVVYAYVLDTDGSIITDGTKGGKPGLRFRILDDPVSRRAAGAEETLVQFGTDALDVAKPVYLHGEKLGAVRIGFSLEGYRQEIADIRNRNLLLGLGALLGGLAVTLALVLAVTRALGRLIEGTEAVYKGDLSHRIEIDTKDELQALAVSYNRMTESLQQSREELERSHAELERRVEERTAELSRTNRRLEDEIAEHRRTEEKLVRVQRLRALGELSAGISHNLNNILTGILGPAELLEMEETDLKKRERLSTILRSGQRAAGLVQRLYYAVRGRDESLQSVDLNEVIEEAAIATRPRWKDEPEASGATIDLVTNLGDIPPVQATSSGLHDLVTNLLLNAVDAMSDGGTITVTTGVDSETVRLTVRDTGEGMDERTRRRVFEPFFTTKADVGTGLGLSIVYTTVTRWEGNIEVESAPGEGTTFVVDLPVSAKAPAARDEEVGIPQRRRGCILVVDDEEIICETLSEILSSEHAVDMALNARDALSLFSPAKYDAVLIDLGMPETPGDVLREKLSQIDPAVATVLITGWNLDEDDRRYSAFDFSLEKPFTGIPRILEVVAQAIELHDTRAEEASARRAMD